MGLQRNNETLSIFIRMVQSRSQVDLDVPANSLPADVIEALLSDPRLGIPKVEPKTLTPITYTLAKKGVEGIDEAELAANSTLAQSGVKDKDVLLLVPNMVAGFC